MGISQKALAAQTGISASYLNLIEHNRRGIGGRTLIALADALGLPAADLSEGADRALVDNVKKAALVHQSSQAELSRAEEFTARFPGFSRALVALQEISQRQELEFTALSDQMQSDPFFAEAVYLMLSSVTTILSTAEILADTDDLSEARRNRFAENLKVEARKLAETANEILVHYEPRSKWQANAADQSGFEQILAAADYFIEEIEKGEVALSSFVAQMPDPPEGVEKFTASLKSYQDMAGHMPITPFLDIAKRQDFDPIAISEKIASDLPQVLFRLAHLPLDDDLPRFGLIQCDGSGAVLYRKELSNFGLPRFGGACPLWPLYRSFAVTGQPIAAILDMPSGERFYAMSIAYPTSKPVLGLPANSESIMLFTPDLDMMLKGNASILPQINAGVQCTVCPRSDCASRRSDYLLGRTGKNR